MGVLRVYRVDGSYEKREGFGSRGFLLRVKVKCFLFFRF